MLKKNIFIIILLIIPITYASSISQCDVVSRQCNQNEIELFKLSSNSNAHAQLSTSNTYAWRVCCQVDNIVQQCSGNKEEVLSLSGNTNAHAEAYVASGDYTIDICLKPNDNSKANCVLRYNNDICPSNYQCVVALSSTQNAHLGDCTSYPISVCCGIPPAGSALCNNDNNIDPGESCDGIELGLINGNNASCSSFPGFTSGTLSCNANCEYNTDLCLPANNPGVCNNNQLDLGEQCDRNNFGSLSCESFGFLGGTLSCSSDCKSIYTNECTTIRPTCDIFNVTAVPNCGSDPFPTCDNGELINIALHYNLNTCPVQPYFQVDFSDTSCTIERTNADITGVSFDYTHCIDGRCDFTWQIPNIPNDCKGRIMYTLAAGLYNDSSYNINSFVTSIAGSQQEVSGSFVFAGVPASVCGDSIIDTGENCANCPDDAGCVEGEFCDLSTNQCTNTAQGVCNNDNICNENENCDCNDCSNQQSHCRQDYFCDPELDLSFGCTLEPTLAGGNPCPGFICTESANSGWLCDSGSGFSVNGFVDSDDGGYGLGARCCLVECRNPQQEITKIIETLSGECNDADNDNKYTIQVLVQVGNSAPVAEERACTILPEKVPFFSIINILITVILLAFFYSYKIRKS